MNYFKSLYRTHVNIKISGTIPLETGMTVPSPTDILQTLFSSNRFNIIIIRDAHLVFLLEVKKNSKYSHLL